MQTQFGDLQEKYNSQALSLRECETNNKNYEQMLKAAQAALEDLRASNSNLQSSLASSVSSSGTNISKLVDEINASNKYIKQLVEAKSKSDSLSLALTNKLTRSLSKEELKDVDVQVLKGVVYISLNDNMLYKSGSYAISEKAGASSVVQELQNRYGVNPSRMTAGGRGEYNPLADNATSEGRTRNRRTQIIITPQLDQFMELIDQAPATEN